MAHASKVPEKVSTLSCGKAVGKSVIGRPISV